MNISTKLAARLGRIPARQLYAPRSTVILSPWAQFLPSRPYSSDAAPAPPPLLTKLKGDLKTAMRAKDAPRLAVIKNTLAAVLNANKTASPIRTDPHIIALLRKAAATETETAKEFRDNGRPDQAGEHMAQVRIIEEYIESSGVTLLADEELRVILQKVVDEVTAGGAATNARFSEAMKTIKSTGEKLFEGRETGGMGRVTAALKELLAGPK